MTDLGVKTAVDLGKAGIEQDVLRGMVLVYGDHFAGIAADCGNFDFSF